MFVSRPCLQHLADVRERQQLGTGLSRALWQSASDMLHFAFLQANGKRRY